MITSVQKCRQNRQYLVLTKNYTVSQKDFKVMILFNVK